MKILLLKPLPPCSKYPDENEYFNSIFLPGILFEATLEVTRHNEWTLKGKQHGVDSFRILPEEQDCFKVIEP